MISLFCKHKFKEISRVEKSVFNENNINPNRKRIIAKYFCNKCGKEKNVIISDIKDNSFSW
jgi:hypothetical protein